MNEIQQKIKNPIYLVWLIVRTVLGLLCGLIGYIALDESGFVNFLFWLLLGTQFWLDGDMLKSMFKVNRFVIASILFICIIMTI